MNIDHLNEELIALAKADSWYQACLRRMKAAEPAYLLIKNSMPAAQQEALDRYIAACEEVEHALVYLAWRR